MPNDTNQPSPNDNQPTAARSPKNTSVVWVIVILAILILGSGIVLFAMRTDRDAASLSDTSKTGESSIGVKDPSQYNWSTMQQGPYKDRISYATGTSLTNWTDSEQILASHASVPDVILKDGILYVYFVDVSQDGKPEQIGLIKSTDNGKTWSSKQIVMINGLGSKVAVDPDPYLLADGRIRLYYFDISTTKTLGLQNNAIYSAISTDGVTFTEESGVRFKYPAIFDPDVIKVGDTWRMYVGTDDQKVLSATSTDGLTFTYEGVALSGASIPNAIYENSTYYLFTGGIEIASSIDGKTFTKTAHRFDSGGLTADPGVVKLSDGSYFMIYKTDDGTLAPPNPGPDEKR